VLEVNHFFKVITKKKTDKEKKKKKKLCSPSGTNRRAAKTAGMKRENVSHYTTCAKLSNFE